jgi:hypothetical protein
MCSCGQTMCFVFGGRPRRVYEIKAQHLLQLLAIFKTGGCFALLQLATCCCCK